MSLRNNRTLTVLLAAGVLVGGANLAAYAATGGAFVLGRSNSANQASTLVNTGPGPALKIRTRPAAPPFAVSSAKKVARLNADTLDGLNSTQLQTRSRIYRIPASVSVSSLELTLAGLTPGIYQASFSVIANMSAPGAQINCHFYNAASGFYELMGYGSTFSSYSSSNAAGIVDTRSTSKNFRCFALGGTATVDADYANQSQIVMTRISGLTPAATGPAARTASPRVGGARQR